MAGLPHLFTKNPSELLRFFESGIHDQNIHVRLATIKAACYTLIEVDESTRHSMLNLIPALLNVFIS